jgi:hypothetical protein
MVGELKKQPTPFNLTGMVDLNYILLYKNISQNVMF